MSNGPAFADPDKLLAWHEQVHKLLEYRAQGLNTKQAAEKVGVSPQHAAKLIADAVAHVRENTDNLVQQRILEHDAKLEWMYNECAKQMQRLAELNAFDDKVLRAAVSILDRQAKLWGLDKAKQGTGGSSRLDWLDTASSAALMAEAERYGIKIPEPFKAAAGVT